MAMHAKTVAELKNIDKNPSKVRSSEFSNPNTYSFKNMVKYISSLHEKGIVDDEGFTNLLLYACSIFIENEVNERFQKILANKLPLLYNLGR